MFRSNEFQLPQNKATIALTLSFRQKGDAYDAYCGLAFGDRGGPQGKPHPVFNNKR